MKNPEMIPAHPIECERSYDGRHVFVAYKEDGQVKVRCRHCRQSEEPQEDAKNAALERIECERKCEGCKNAAPELPVGIEGALHDIEVAVCVIDKYGHQKIATLREYIKGLQPIPSESDEAVECLRMIADGEGDAQVLAQQTLDSLARRQTAVSNTAEEEREAIHWLMTETSHLDLGAEEGGAMAVMRNIVTGYNNALTAAELNGARKALEAAADKVWDVGILQSKPDASSLYEQGMHEKCMEAFNAIRALNPADVIKGE